MDTLFIDVNGRAYDARDILRALKSIGADDCEVLFIHSDVVFGSPPPVFNRKEYLQILYGTLLELKVPIIAPVFTYSFCNNEDYDVKRSKTSMGALNEYIRKQEGRYRTLDPLLSLSVPMEMAKKFANVPEHSLGSGCGLDILHGMDGVKFLFFGAKQSECFTYVHYVEKMMDVPYRYDQQFDGIVIDYDGQRYKKRQSIHTHCYGVKIPSDYGYFEDDLIRKNLVRKCRLGNSYVSCLGEKDAFREICSRIENDPYYFVQGTYRDEDLIHKYGFGHSGERVTHC